MRQHNRSYTGQEMTSRVKLLKNIKRVVDGVEFGLTSRSDRFFHEKQRNIHLKKHHIVKRSPIQQHVHLTTSPKLPPIDWRNINGKNHVTPVKDQGSCGGCFAFASAAVLEFWSDTSMGTPTSLSEQSLMDCTSNSYQPNEGCDGGLMEYVFEYAKTHPVPLESEFPYRNSEHQCPQRELTRVKVDNYKVLTRLEKADAEAELEWILHTYGPVSVGIDSTNIDNYSGGIFKAHMCSTEIDHAVTIVGYTKDAWIIKNSWGLNWGVDGYLYLERGANACGVAEYIVYITSANPESKTLSTQWSPTDYW